MTWAGSLPCHLLSLTLLLLLLPLLSPLSFTTSQSGILYPVVVRFETQNYAGVNTNNFALDEVQPAK
jgi:hypothetical protein